MSKLHKLRRAILKDPDKFHTKGYVFYGATIGKNGKVYRTYATDSHKKFIEKVVKGLNK